MKMQQLINRVDRPDVTEWYDESRSITRGVWYDTDLDKDVEVIMWITYCEICRDRIRVTVREFDTIHGGLDGKIIESEKNDICHCEIPF